MNITHTLLKYVNEKINFSAVMNQSTKIKENEISRYTNRWLNIPLKDLWQSINWSGILETRTFNNQDQPKSCDFKRHYETLLNLPGETELFNEFDVSNVPIHNETDKQIDHSEVQDAVNSMKDNSSGPDGVASGLLKYLPVQ